LKRERERERERERGRKKERKELITFLLFLSIVGKYYREAIQLAVNPIPKLEWISSWHTQLSDFELVLVIEALKDNKPTNINTFNMNKLFKKELLTNTCIIHSVKSLGSSLKTFELSNSPISDEALQAIAKFCPKATTIILSG
jgi:hypothetical protein